MSQQTSGLRFDIYERVHLAEDTVGIRELNSIELAPDITVDTQGDQAVLKGRLMLTGSYIGDDENGGERLLTHAIPVEITLPLHRVQQVNDIRIEIENFDVDLLSKRSMNVTGVLSLGGIELADHQAAWREEEIVFSHRVEPQQQSPEPAAAANEESVVAAAEVKAVEEPSAAEEEADENEAAQQTEANEAAEAVAEIEAIEPAAEEPNEEPAAEPLEANGNAAEKREPQEIKIAFSGKPPESSGSAAIGVKDILTLTGGGATVHRQPAAADSDAPESGGIEDEESAASAKDQLEWRKLFLQRSEEGAAFRTVKMCIVQKEDTLETIAERYKKNPRELMLYNRLNEQYLQEGQIVYIPQ